MSARVGRIGRAALVALALVGLAGRIAAAQTCTAGYPGSCVVAGSATITIPKVMSFSLSAGTTTAPTPTYADYLQGYNETAGPVVTVSANTAWTVSLSAGTALWSATANGTATPRADKPSADLLWTRTAGSGWAGLTTTSATLASGTAASAVAIPLYYRVLYSLALDTPGTYSLDVVVTVVTP